MRGLASRLKGGARSPFFRAVAMLSGGQTVAIMVPIFTAPILGRLYGPVDYGPLTQYMAFAAVLSVLACFQFQHAIITEASERNAGAVAWLCMLSALLVGGLVAIACALLWQPLLKESAAARWFLLLPLTVLGAGIVAAGSFLSNRHSRYRWIAAVQVGQVVATVTLSITLGIFSWGADGLLAAYFLGQFLQVVAYALQLWRFRDSLRVPSLARLRFIVRRQWKFAVFTTPSEFAGQVNMQAPVFALSALREEAALGAFARAQQLVSLPITLLAGSVSQVFRRDAARLYSETGSCRGLVIRTSGALLAVGIIPCGVSIAIAPWLFATYLGPSWREAGEIAQFLAPMLLLKLVVSPVTTVFYIAGRQHEDFALTLGSSILMLAMVYAANATYGNATSTIIAYTISFSIIYIIYFIRTLVLSERRDK